MTRYSVQSVDPAKTASARGAYLRTSFKNTYEVAGAIRGWNVQKALVYLEQVTDHERAIPFRKHAGSIGRTGQGKEFGVTKARWPVKSIKFIQDLLQNAEANAEAKGLDKEILVISHIQVNQAPKQRRRTYRAHGRINAYQSSPSHIELILSEPAEEVAKPKESSLAHISSRQRGRLAAKKQISA